MDLPGILALLVAPLFAAFLFGVVGVGIRLAIARLMPDCWLKRQILAERFKTKYSRANGRIAEEAARHPRGYRDVIDRIRQSRLHNQRGMPWN